MPDLYFVNAIDAKRMDVLRPNMVMKIFPTGEVHFFQIVHLQLPCSNVECSIMISAFDYDKQKISLVWKDENAVRLNPDFARNDIKVIDHKGIDCSSELFPNYNCIQASYALG